jgi:hypothetical protein
MCKPFSGVCCGHTDKELNIFEIESGDEDMPVMAMPAVPVKTTMRVALDSGAGDHVVGPDDVMGFTTEESEGSKRGRHFIDAGGNRIRNLGQARVGVRDPLCASGFGSVLQIAEVSRPLYSVSKICDSGASVTFDNNEAVVKGRDGAVLAKFKREGGLYVTDLEFTDEGGSTRPGFTGQGADQ